MAARVELAVGVVEEQRRLAAGRGETAGESGEQQQSDSFALAGGGAAARALPPPEDLDFVALRADERLPAGELAGVRLLERRKERRFAVGRARGRGLIAQRHRRPRQLARGGERRERAAELVDQLSPRRDDLGAVPRQQRVPSRELARLRVSGREQRALFGEGALVAPEALEQAGAEVHQATIEEASAQRRRTEQQLVLGVRPDQQRQRREVLGQGGALAVELAAAPRGARPAERELAPWPLADRELDAECVGAAAGAELDARRAEAAAGRGEIDRLEQCRLAGAVAADEQQPLGRRLPVERGEVAEVGEPEAQRGGGQRPRRQMRIGMMTQR